MKPIDSKRTLTMVNHYRALDILDQAAERPMTLDELTFLMGNLIGPISLTDEQPQDVSWPVERMKDTRLDGPVCRRLDRVITTT